MTRSPATLLLALSVGGVLAFGVAGCNQAVIGRPQTVSVPAADVGRSVEPTVDPTAAPAPVVTSTGVLEPVVTTTSRAPRVVVARAPVQAQQVVVTVTPKPRAAHAPEPSSPPPSPQPVHAMPAPPPPFLTSTVLPTPPPVPGYESSIGGEYCSTAGDVNGKYVCATTAADPNRLRWRPVS